MQICTISNAWNLRGQISTSQTGINVLTPVTRTLQSVLDDIVSVRDFGAAGDGITDDTAALNRAISEIYRNALNNIHTNVQRTIKIPAGTYLVSGPIYVPPNCTLIGDGKNNTVIFLDTLSVSHQKINAG